MPTDGNWVPHVRLSFGGTLGVPPLETWSNTLRWRSLSGHVPTPAELATIAQQAGAGAIAPWFYHATTNICGAAALTWVKATWVQANGHQRDLVTATWTPTGSITGAISAGCNFITTHAITLRTDVLRGRGHAGRIYPPMIAVGPEYPTNYIPLAKATEMAQSAALRLLQGIAVSIEGSLPGTGNWRCYIMSKGNEVTGVQPLASPVQTVVVDRVPDIQHRRSKSVPRAEGATVAAI